MERLQKVMASRGVGSRRACEELILAGRVAVNGEIVKEMGTKVGEDDIIAVDGRELTSSHEPLVYLMLNKPKGCVTTVSDPQGRKTVMDLIPDVQYRVYPVGRLDFDTEGLLLLTNDGDLSYVLTHPSHGVEKTYLAVVRGTPSEEAIQQLKRGILLDDGMTSPAQVKLLKRGSRSEILLTIHEGRKRQVRRMLQAVGHPVVSLRRIKFGPLSLNGLPPGKYRYLSTQEIWALKAQQGPVLSRKGSGGDVSGRKPGNERKSGRRNGPGLYRQR